MANNFMKQIGEIGYLTSFVTLAFRNGLEYCNTDGHVNCGDHRRRSRASPVLTAIGLVNGELPLAFVECKLRVINFCQVSPL